MVSAPRTPPRASRDASAVTDVTLEQRSAADSTLAVSTSTFLRLLFFCMPASVLPAASKRAGSAPPGWFAPGLNATAGTSPRAFLDFAAAPCLCFASRLPSPRPKLFGQFHAENASIDCSTTAFVRRVPFGWLNPTPWVSNPTSLSGCYARRGGSISQRARHSVRDSGAALFAAAPAILCFAAARSAAPAILFRAKALFCSGAARIVQARA